MQTEETKDPQSKEDIQEEFFNADNARTDELKDWMGHMKRDKEKIELPGYTTEEEDDPEGEEINSDDIPDEEAEEMLQHFNYTEEHRYTAEFALVQLDKLLSFGFGVFSGKESDNYRRRKQKPAGEDYEAELLAALLFKYQMKMSLEWMFASAIFIAYSPMAEKAIKDRKELKTKEEADRKRREMQIMKEELHYSGQGPASNQTGSRI